MRSWRKFAGVLRICSKMPNLKKKPMEKDEQHENDAAFEDYKDSDNDDDDVEPYEVLFEF